MPELVDIHTATNPRDVIHRAVALLAEGALIGLPTESVYVLGAHALDVNSVRKLAELRESHPGSTLSVCLRGYDDALDFLPDMGRIARRLASRCWPGPVTLRLPVVNRSGLVQALPAETREVVGIGDCVQLQVPGGEVVREVLNLLPAPLLAWTAVSSDSEATSASSLSEIAGDVAGLIVDSGPTRFGQSPTVVHVRDDQVEVVRSGVVAESTLKRLASEMYLFVCTGNTCRSPMAEALFRKILADRLQCAEDELSNRGYVSVSAGIAAAVGAPASPDSVAALDETGIDLREHTSRQLTDRLLEQIDFIFTMTKSHRDSILSIRPDVADRIDLLSREGKDISDPFGGSRQDYLRCKEEIERNISQIVDEIVARENR